MRKNLGTTFFHFIISLWLCKVGSYPVELLIFQVSAFFLKREMSETHTFLSNIRYPADLEPTLHLLISAT